MAQVLLDADELLSLIRQAVRVELDAREGGDTLSTEEAAEIARRDPKTVRRWIAEGVLPTTRRGRLHRIRREDLDRFLAGENPDENVERIVASLHGR